MNEEKNGIIVKINFINEFCPKDSKIVLYTHEIEFENGDKAKIYAKSKLPTGLEVGENIIYIFSNPEKTKIKFVRTVDAASTVVHPPNQAQQINYGQSSQTHYAKSIGAKQNNNNRDYMTPKGLEGNIGYAHSYAKDVLDTIYKQYGDVLKDRKKEFIQRLMDSKIDISDVSLEKMFNEDILMYLKMGRLIYEQMGYLVSAGYDGRVNVEEELRAMIELNVLAPIKKEVIGGRKAAATSNVLFDARGDDFLNEIK